MNGFQFLWIFIFYDPEYISTAREILRTLRGLTVDIFCDF